MRNIFILVMAIYILPSCLNAETKNIKATNSHQSKVYSYLKEELKAGYSHGDEDSAMEMDRDYFSVVGEELRQGLEKSGFKFLEPEIFKTKIKKIFGLNEKDYINESTKDYISTTSLPFSMDMLTFLPDKGLISFAYKMPEIIDYTKKYPELVVFEKHANEAYKKNINKEQRVSWDSIHKDYTQYTKDNRAFILALNKYLLNDDFSQRTWLVENTYKLMYDLYASGYKEDKGLLKALLIENIMGKHKSLEWYGTLENPIEFLLVLPKKVEGYYMIREEAFIHLSDLISDKKEKLSSLHHFVQKFKKLKSYKLAVIYTENFLKQHSSEFHTVFRKKIILDKNTTAELILQEENFKKLADKPAKIILNYTVDGTKKEYIFMDPSKKFPILYFNEPVFNTKISDNINLVNSINIVDNNNQNKIFIYGVSHYGGSGLVGKLIILTKNKRGDIKKIGIIQANDNFEIHYIKKENIIIVAQYIWRQGVEGHYGDTHLYKLDIYDLNNKLKKIPIDITEKKYNDENSSVINDNLDKVLAKYSLYKKNNISQKEENKYRNFVINYWNKISKKDFKFIEKVFSKNAYYYTKILNKKVIIKDKRRVLNSIEKIKFDLKDFLIYKEKNKIKIEYIKTYDIDEGIDGGVVKSMMELEEIDKTLFITNESDIKVLKQNKDID